jgi:hypothetical protein
MIDKKIIIGIDATNLRQGGGVTHLIELLGAAQPDKFGISQVVIWGSELTLNKLSNRPWLIKISPELLNKGLISRSYWQLCQLTKSAKAIECDVLFVPGGTYLGQFKPIVTMSRNLLPFESKELMRYGFTAQTLKVLVLRFIQTISFKRADGLIFLTDYAKRAVVKVIGEVNGMTCTIPHGSNQRFDCAPRFQKNISDYSYRKPFRILYVSRSMGKTSRSILSKIK